MLTVEGTNKNGRIELIEAPRHIRESKVLVTFLASTELPAPSAAPKEASRGFSRHYDPTLPEVAARRKRLFEAINSGHSGESVRALRELARRYSREAGQR